MSAVQCAKQSNPQVSKLNGRRFPQHHVKRSKSGSKGDGEVTCFAYRPKGHLRRDGPFIRGGNCNSGGHPAHACKKPRACVAISLKAPPSVSPTVSQPGMCTFMASSAEPSVAPSAESFVASNAEPSVVPVLSRLLFHVLNLQLM